MSVNIDQVIQKAQQLCDTAGVNLTQKRKNVLVVLLRSQLPQSAYEVVEQYKSDFNEVLPVMSAYRMLDFLVHEKLAHKLDTTNQYIACSHITCDHQHEVPQFLICDSCHIVREVGVKKTIVNDLQSSVENTGFALKSQQLELHGLCEKCRNN